MGGDVKKIELNKIYNMDCVAGMKLIPDNFVDLVVTSPPYDNLREYNGYSFDFESTAKELYRVVKDGGVVVWVVGDQTSNGSESGTSFKQALYFKEIGFNIHDTMIWNKISFNSVGDLQTRYAQVFEYMFVFSKGNVTTFNQIKDRKNKSKGRTIHGNKRLKDGTFRELSTCGNMIGEYGVRFNIWEMYPSDRNNHPAPFPEKLVEDHLKSWSNDGDIVLDPFMGSGTTAKVCLGMQRKFIGFEISKEYCEEAEKRIDYLKRQLTIFELMGGETET